MTPRNAGENGKLLSEGKQALCQYHNTRITKLELVSDEDHLNDELSLNRSLSGGTLGTHQQKLPQVSKFLVDQQINTSKEKSN